MLLSKNVWGLGKQDDQAMQDLFCVFPFSFQRNMEFLPLKTQIILIQVSIFHLQVHHVQKIISFP